MFRRHMFLGEHIAIELWTACSGILGEFIKLSVPVWEGHSNRNRRFLLQVVALESGGGSQMRYSFEKKVPANPTTMLHRCFCGFLRGARATHCYHRLVLALCVGTLAGATRYTTPGYPQEFPSHLILTAGVSFLRGENDLEDESTLWEEGRSNPNKFSGLVC